MIQLYINKIIRNQPAKMKSSSPRKIQMQTVSPKIQLLISDVKSIYQHPYHYTYVVQKNDNFIYLYDQKTLEYIGKTKVNFLQNFKTFTFTDNFNVFCAYIEGRSNPIQQPQIVIFTLNPDSTIAHQRHPLVRNQKPQNLPLFNIDYYQRPQRQPKQKDRESIIGISPNKIHYINMTGQVVKQIQLYYNRQLKLLNAFVIKQRKWIFVQENKLYFAAIYDSYTIEDCLTLDYKISSIFRGPTLKTQFIALACQMHCIVLLTQQYGKWSVRYKFKVPNLNIRKACFYFPGVNTSTTHKFKDKLFLLIHGQPSHLFNQKNSTNNDDEINSFLVPQDLLKDTHIFVYEYSIQQLLGNIQVENNTLLKKTFCLKGVGNIKYSIWVNEHALNQVRIFNQNHNILSVDLLGLIDEPFAGKEWVCLGYRFQAMSKNKLYEETEDIFQVQQKVFRTVKYEEVNDWSHSLFPKESVLRKTIKRLNCLDF